MGVIARSRRADSIISAQKLGLNERKTLCTVAGRIFFLLRGGFDGLQTHARWRIEFRSAGGRFAVRRHVALRRRRRRRRRVAKRRRPDLQSRRRRRRRRDPRRQVSRPAGQLGRQRARVHDARGAAELVRAGAQMEMGRPGQERGLDRRLDDTHRREPHRRRQQRRSEPLRHPRRRHRDGGQRRVLALGQAVHASRHRRHGGVHVRRHHRRRRRVARARGSRRRQGPRNPRDRSAGSPRHLRQQGRDQIHGRRHPGVDEHVRVVRIDRRVGSRRRRDARDRLRLRGLRQPRQAQVERAERGARLLVPDARPRPISTATASSR